MPLMIKLNRNIMKVDLCLDNGHFITVFITEPFFSYSTLSHLKHIITMFYIIRSKMSMTTSDERIRNMLYKYQSINRVIDILLKEGGTYRTQTIRYREEL